MSSWQHTLSHQSCGDHIYPTQLWVFWDHAPVWLMPSGQQSVLISEDEQLSGKARRRQSAAAKRSVTAALEAVLADGADPVRLPVPSSDMPSQTVGPGSGSAQKYRLTLLMVQSIEGRFDPSRNPKGFSCQIDVFYI